MTKQKIHIPLYLHKQPCGMITDVACHTKGQTYAWSQYWKDITCNNCLRTHIYQILKKSQKNYNPKRKDHIIAINPNRISFIKNMKREKGKKKRRSKRDNS